MEHLVCAVENGRLKKMPKTPPLLLKFFLSLTSLLCIAHTKLTKSSEKKPNKTYLNK